MDVEYSQDGRLLKRVMNAEGHFEIPDSVETIEWQAFRECEKLTSISIPQTVTDIKGFPFVGCDNLERINVSPENPCYLSEDGILYTKDKSKIVTCPAGKKQERFAIQDSVVRICAGAFFHCKGLSAINISDSVVGIDMQAFEGCVSLTDVQIPESVVELGDFAFKDCI